MFESKNIKPMLLKEVPKPFNNEEYLYELKFDGYRVIMYVSDSELVIKSRNNIDITYLYPELDGIKKIVGNNKVIFDGEIVAMSNGKPDFSKLQIRSHLKDTSKIELIKDEIPVVFVAFDVLFMNKELVNESLIRRKKILEKFQDSNVFIKSKVFYKGVELFELVKKQELEGIIAKKKNSLYIPNKRVDFWLKIKNFKEDYFVVHGYVFNKEKYSLYLGEYVNDKLYFVGKVSTGDCLLINKVKKHSSVNNMFINCHDNVNYIKPDLKVLIRYLEKSKDKKLRQPVLIK